MVFFGFDVEREKVTRRFNPLNATPFYAEKVGKTMFRILMPVRSIGAMQAMIQQNDGSGNLIVVTGGVDPGSWYSKTVVRITGWTNNPSYSVHMMAIYHEPLSKDRYPIVNKLFDRMWSGLSEQELESVVHKLDNDPDLQHLVSVGHDASEIISLCL